MRVNARAYWCQGAVSYRCLGGDHFAARSFSFFDAFAGPVDDVDRQPGSLAESGSGPGIISQQSSSINPCTCTP